MRSSHSPATASAGRLRERSGGQALVDQLLIHGADRAFCVPGESYLEVLDALYDVRDRIALVNARHEAGAANMAEAYGKLTGRPGIAMVTRGPGACHAAVGIHIAFQDSTPLILLVGQVAREMAEREAFQEIDYRKMFAPVAKWVVQIEQAQRIPELMARAFHVATSGRPGPVVVSLPEDMLTDRVSVPDASPYEAVQARASAGDMARMSALIASAERPLMILGGSAWTDPACADMLAFAEAHDLPAATAFRRQDLFQSRSPCYAGELGTTLSPELGRRVKDSDLLLVVGARLGDMTTQGYALLDVPEPRQKLIHIHPDADELGRVFRPVLAIVSGPAAFAAQAVALSPASRPRWAEWTAAAHRDYLANAEPVSHNGPFDAGRAMVALRERLPADAIVTIDAGNFSGWPQRFLTHGRPGRQLGPTNGSMGYAVPAAVAASLIHPERLVIGCVGDGGFMMSGQEIATAVQHGGRPIVLVFNNRIYGTIRMHQEREHPGRVVGTDLVNPDFAALGRALGCHGETVRRTDEFLPALERAIAARKPAVIELQTDPEIISTRTTVAALREAARQRSKPPA